MLTTAPLEAKKNDEFIPVHRTSRVLDGATVYDELCCRRDKTLFVRTLDESGSLLNWHELPRTGI